MDNDEEPEDPVDDEEDASLYWISIAPQDLALINSILGEVDASVPNRSIRNRLQEAAFNRNRQ